jgi:hypothetical protein
MSSRQKGHLTLTTAAGYPKKTSATS